MSDKFEYETELKELKRDFIKLFKKCHIAEDYAPEDKEFERALRVGIMYHILKHLKLDKCNDEDDDTEERKKDRAEERGYEFDPDCPVDAELKNAERYIDLLDKTEEEDYRRMATDALSHAQTILRKKYEKADDDDKRELRKKEAYLNKLKRDV